MRDQELSRALRNGFLLFFFFLSLIMSNFFYQTFQEKVNYIKIYLNQTFWRFSFKWWHFYICILYCIFFSFDYGRTIIWFLFSFIFCVQQLSFGFFFFFFALLLGFNKFFPSKSCFPTRYCAPIIAFGIAYVYNS